MNLIHLLIAGALLYAGTLIKLVDEDHMHRVGTWEGELRNGEMLVIRIYRDFESTARYKDTMIFQKGENGQEVKKLGTWDGLEFVGSPTAFVPNALSGGGPLFETSRWGMACRNLVAYEIPDGTFLQLTEGPDKFKRNP